MRIEQTFSQSDLEELYQVLSKSTEVKRRGLRFWMRHRKAYQCSLIVFAFILFADSAFLITRMKWFAITIAIIGIFALLYLFAWNKMVDKFLNPEIMIQKYREPFSVEVEGNIFHFGRLDFTISSIDHIVEYKYFLFIRANRKWFFMKAEPEEKAMLLSELNNHSNITFTQIEEPIDLRQFR